MKKVMVFASAVAALAAAGFGAPAFTRQPAATSADAKTTITFAVDQPTDVAVFIEDTKGRIVRHLVAGVLGNNPPAPLEANTLEQAVVWDRMADYGKPAGEGPFRVRVALGLSAKYDKVLISDPNTFQHIKSVAVGPDGTLYVVDELGGAVWWDVNILAFDRAGRYQRTVQPFPASLSLDQVKDLGAFELRGRPAAMVQAHGLRLHPFKLTPRKSTMAVTADGTVLLRLTGGSRDNHAVHLSAIGTDGSARWKDPVGPSLFSELLVSEAGKEVGGIGQRPCVVISSDGKWAYIAGILTKNFAKVSAPAVFRVPLPARGQAEMFFGHPTETGGGKTRLGGEPRGLAVDGKGHLLISDPANGRVVVVAEADGAYVGEFAAARPDGLAVNPGTGHVYLQNMTGPLAFEVVKYSGWNDPQVLAKADLRCGGNPAFPAVMAVDTGPDNPIVWLGGDDGVLLRVEDLGREFGAARTASNTETGAGCFLDVTVDRWRPDREIYTRCGVKHDWWYRYNEATDKIEKVRIGTVLRSGGVGVGARPAPDGFLYGLCYPYELEKYDRNGKIQLWAEPYHPADAARKGEPVAPSKKFVWSPNSETALTHTLGIRHDGHIFALETATPGGRPPKMLHEYLPSGKRVTTDPIIWKTSDAALGPHFDAQGNIYIAEYVKPPDWPYPPEFNAVFGPVKGRLRAGPQAETAQMYGSILKFSPRGGMVHVPTKGSVEAGPDPFKGQPKLDGLESMELAYTFNGLMDPITVTGAEWVHPGISHCGVFSCTCENVTFDVDEFGRVWFPDLNLYQVRVIDTNGQAITQFGGYGNADSCGPDSRGPSLARPEVAFAWLVGVAATDRYVYTGDSINRRMLRLKQTYAAEAVCEVK